jgi:hypothetical protein
MCEPIVDHERVEPICSIRLRVSNVNGSCIFFAPFPSNPEVLIRSGSEEHVLAALLHVTTSSGELAEKELWAKLAPIRSAMPIAKFPNTSPAPRLDLG